MRTEIQWAKSLIPWAHEHNIPVVCLPHGDHCHTGDMLRTVEINHVLADVYAPVAMFDSLVVPNAHCGKRYQAHLPGDRIFILGSPRFNMEWLGVLDKLMPSFSIPTAGDKCKAALFLRHHGYPLFWEEIYWTIRLITQFPHVQLAIIPHTRGWGWDPLVEAYPEINAEINNLTLIEDNVYSGAVVKWADIILDIGTSMAFEAVIRNKAIICPEYLHATRTVTSQYFPNAVAWCRDDLFDMFAALHENPNKRFHSSAEAKSFIANMIHVPDANVLDRYVDFLLNVIDQSVYHDGFAVNTSGNLHDNEQIIPASLIAKYSQLQRQYDQLHHTHDQLHHKYDQLHQEIFELITAHVRCFWKNILKDEGIKSVALFGAGAHTRWLLDIIAEIHEPKIVGIFDDNAVEGQLIGKIPVLKPDHIRQDFDALVLSTDVHQAVFTKRCRQLWGHGITLIDLYKGLPFGPYPKDVKNA